MYPDSLPFANEEGTYMVNETLIFVVNDALKIMVNAGLMGSSAH